MPTFDFDRWLAYGIGHGYCSEQACATHDGYPMSDAEMELDLSERDELCIHIVRLGTPVEWDQEFDHPTNNQEGE